MCVLYILVSRDKMGNKNEKAPCPDGRSLSQPDLLLSKTADYVMHLELRIRFLEALSLPESSIGHHTKICNFPVKDFIKNKTKKLGDLIRETSP
ncbi:hypothetical protein YC2023_058768 [Brassica napus]